MVLLHLLMRHMILSQNHFSCRKLERHSLQEIREAIMTMIRIILRMIRMHFQLQLNLRKRKNQFGKMLHMSGQRIRVQ